MTYNQFEAAYDDLVEALAAGEIDEDEFEREHDALIDEYYANGED